MLRRAVPVLVPLGLGAAVVAWTVFLPTGLDRLWPWAAVPAGPLASVALVVAFVAQPTVAYLCVLIPVTVLARRRWRDLAGSLLLATVLTLSLTTLLKSLVGRARPVTPWLQGLDPMASFPSGHASASAALAIAVTQTTWALTRRRRRTALVAASAGIVALSISVDRLVLGVHHVSDVLGAILIAGFSATLAASLTCARPVAGVSGGPRQIHVVWHPGRVRGQVGLARFLAAEARRRGWPDPHWLATSAADHGGGCARRALRDGSDLVVVLGGDGTLREVLAALARHDIPVAVVPSGSGNLLAKNLAVPLDAARAVRLALTGPARPMDLLRVEVDGGEPRWAVAMVGAGADAAVLRDTSPVAKRVVGPLGYLLAGRRHIRPLPRTATISLDGASSEQPASLVLVGNVGSLHPGIALLPEADPGDGRLDVLVASPRGRGDVVAMMAGVLLRRRRIAHVERRSGLEVCVTLNEPTPFQIDGDVIGDVVSVRVEVVPAAVSVVG